MPAKRGIGLEFSGQVTRSESGRVVRKGRKVAKLDTCNSFDLSPSPLHHSVPRAAEAAMVKASLANVFHLMPMSLFSGAIMSAATLLLGWLFAEGRQVFPFSPRIEDFSQSKYRSVGSSRMLSTPPPACN